MRLCFALAAIVTMQAVAPAYAGTLPSRLADQVDATDPKAASLDCQAAQADARDWSEGGVAKVLKGVGRVVIWPLGERSAQRRSDQKNEARELVMERVRQACFTQPTFTRAPPTPGQRWPGGKGYDRSQRYLAQAGGRTVMVIIHPKANTLWLRTGEGGPGFELWSSDAWVAPVAWSLEPFGCRITEDHPAPANSREAGFICPQDVDLRALVRAVAPDGRLRP
jgi:hypothetical protein